MAMKSFCPPHPESLPRGRLAPSPTGALHLGNARTFLITWMDIRSRGGDIILRMEDLDHPKVKPGAAAEAIEDLRWLGLDWDEGPDEGGPHAPYTQSERIEHYANALARLRRQEKVYPCTCTRRDVAAAQSAPHPGEDGPRYPGTCRGRHRSYDAAQAQLPPTRLPAWRFIAPDITTTFRDRLHGEQRQNVQQVVGDFPLARHPDGAGYMLAVVVDDIAMGINEVVRGDDLLSTTHRQLALYEALEWDPPVYMHVPLVVSPEGRRLAKRHGDTRIATLRKRGIEPEKVLGLLAWWSGWAERGECVTSEELLNRYDFNRLPRTPAVLTEEVKAYLGIREADDGKPTR